jgi:phosphoenolpyruvate synthase/pyruvate phosphate dikinase
MSVSDLTLTESSVKPPSGALGGKAASLVQLSEWGLPVPEFTVIAAPALRECLRAGGLQHLDAADCCRSSLCL